MTLRTIGFIVFKNLHDFVVVKKRGMLYTAGLIVSHLQLLFVVVAVLNNHNKPRWLTCDPTWRACAEYITWCRSSGISNHRDNTNWINMAEGYANSLYNWPNMNWVAADFHQRMGEVLSTL